MVAFDELQLGSLIDRSYGNVSNGTRVKALKRLSVFRCMIGRSLK